MTKLLVILLLSFSFIVPASSFKAAKKKKEVKLKFKAEKRKKDEARKKLLKS